MNSMLSFFSKPLASGWSAHPTNPLALLLLAAAASAIVALTVWTYSGRMGGDRRRMLLRETCLRIR